MSKVTSKLQVTIPKKLADRLGIRPGDELEWLEAGNALRVQPVGRGDRSGQTLATRLEWFDPATQRQQKRQQTRPVIAQLEDRGWTREELYDRGGSG